MTVGVNYHGVSGPVEGLTGATVAVAVKVVVGENTGFPPLKHMDDQLFSGDAHCIHQVFINGIYDFLNTFLGQAFIHRQRNVDNVVGEVDVDAADRPVLFQNGIGFGVGCPDLAFEVEFRQLDFPLFPNLAATSNDPLV